MKRIRRTIAAVLAAALTYWVFFGTMTPSFAAAVPVDIYVDDYDSGTLTLSWDQVPGVQSVEILYHIPNQTDDPQAREDRYDQTTNSATLSSKLKADYIYDIEVRLYDASGGSGGGGAMIGRGFIYYLPQITFTSKAIEVPAERVTTGGGWQSGNYPRLELKWKIPRVFNGLNKFVMADTVLETMEQTIGLIYSDGRELDTLNFRVNISSNINLLNSGSAQTSVLINNDSGSYKANLSGGIPANAAQVEELEDAFGVRTGELRFELWGHSDPASSTDYLTQDEKADTDFSAPNALKDPDILPGSVYYMNIKPIFKNQAGQTQSAVTVGNPEDQNGSILSGLTQYSYTPIRFQLTKDSANNIYVKIYKINQGSLDLPRLFYEVQASDDPSIPGDWDIKKTMDDSYFIGSYAVTVISGVNPNNEIYYKIVVKSDSQGDKLESLKMPYTLTVDTSRPPLPTGIAVTNRTLDVVRVTPPVPNSTAIDVKSTDVTISWDKPLNWDATMAANLSYHFLLSTSQSDITTDVPLYVDGGTNGLTYWDSYPAKFRLVKYINANNAKIRQVGNKLTFTLKADDLFTWEKAGGTSGGIVNTEGTYGEGYPDFLLPNTVYYLQMYTTNANDAGTQDVNKMSDKSIITSFTTLNGIELEVPLPMGFSLDANNKNSDSVNYVDLTFDKVMNLDWNNYTSSYNTALYNYNIYYDVMMNSRTNTAFTLIGSTSNLHGDIEFTGADDPASTSIKARVSEFTTPAAIAIFGDKLQPNTTYYFKVKTRLVITDKSGVLQDEKVSMDTAILPVTTIVVDVTPPDDSLRKPLAPTDFSVAIDDDGNPLLSGSSVTFTWQRQENDVIYQLIRTGQKTNPTDQQAAYEDDPEYTSFLPAYDQVSDGVTNGFIYIDPAPGTGYVTDPGKFTYDSATRICTYTIDRRLFPNKLYYFSLKAIRIIRTPAGYNTGAESVWVSVPVTTSLIEPPARLESVNGAELGFSWTDGTPGMTAEDYMMYARGPGDSDYKLMTRSQSTVVKDADGRTYYGRLLNLKPNSSYDVRVFRGAGSGGTLVYDKRGLQTRDGYHQLEVKWMGLPIDDFSRYEVAVMAEGSSAYTTLSGNDLEYYPDKNGNLLPYYTEETPLTVNNGNLYYHARIKQVEVVLPGGLVTHQPLRSNVKYYIKVRAVKVDATDNALVSYSKYIGPVYSRTEFNQDDYDNTDREEKQEAIFLDRMKELEQGFYWRIAVDNSAADRILLKGDRVVNAMRSMSGNTFTIDLTAINVNIDRDEVYVPVSVVRAMNSTNKSLLIKTPGAEFLLRPDTLDASENKQIKELLARTAVKDLYLRLIAARTDTAPAGFPTGGERISKINDLEVQAIGSSRSDSELKKLFDDRLYNKDSGLVGQKLNILQNTYIGNGPDASKIMNDYTERLVEIIERELSVYIDSTIESIKLAGATQVLTEFSSPLSVTISCADRQGTKIPYVLYDGSSSWQKLTDSAQQNGSVGLNVMKTGKYVVLLVQGTTKDIPDGYWAKEDISKLTSKYDLSGVFSGIGTSFMPDNKVTCREVILLFEKVTGRTSLNAGLDIKQKTAKLGLDGIINPNGVMKNIRREETAAVLLKLFAAKKGMDADSLRPGGNVYIADEAEVDADYYNSVLLIVDLGVMGTNGEGNFLPAANMTRAEVSVAFVRLLELTGDM